VTGESEERATRMRDDWGITGIPARVRALESQMRECGLFVSRSIGDDEPPVFNAPSIRSHRLLHVAALPVGRPRLDDHLDGIDLLGANDAAPRGGA
jgi:hypothetical protein